MAARSVRLDRIITLQSRTVTRDSTFGSEIEEWTDVEQVWANVNQTGTSEVFKNDANRTLALRNATIRIRWRPDVKETWRVVYNKLLWNIKGIGQVGFRRELELFVETDVSRPAPDPAPVRSERDAESPEPGPAKPDELPKRT